MGKTGTPQKSPKGTQPYVIPGQQLLQKNPQLSRQEEGKYDWRELDLFLAKLRAMLGPETLASAFNIPRAFENGYSPATGTGSNTLASGTVDLVINGVTYHLLKADAP